ncbi:iron uptake transporter deferrochelatase/peroxidase subunit [Naasia lichenicola]|uniref:Deferrochelatase n=1 Tax=Naasia lichenicola TaxID=2565933 RepID=A0A4S4FFH1_9MICO|nr:iron uptake transporter deferrochelatase/peroxidase subunit [Naasia lichenicola]THG28472.1 deferrochelatase/peroxidase EfeB [Naasia lichenicola]
MTKKPDTAAETEAVDGTTAEPVSKPGVSRRGLFGLIGVGAAGVAVGAGGGVGAAAAVGSFGTQGTSRTYDFFGTHQAGIVTPSQDRLHFAVYDMAAGASPDDLIALLQEWSAAAARMTQGLEVGETGATGGSLLAPPQDTGEAIGLPASGLTITIGFGPSLFTAADGTDRFGLAASKPALLEPLPRFSGDALLPGATGGDLCIQACADDPQVAVHAIRNLSRIAFGRAAIRWSELGFGRTSSTSTTQATARNLFGFKDGTQNVKAEETKAVDEHIWVGSDDGPAWMAGGSYLVARKIRMIIETWDRTQLQEQENVIGRDKGEGAPLSGGTEFTAIDFGAKLATGDPAVPADAHVRLAHPDNNGGARLLRRGYNYVAGNDELGRLDAGLFFISFQRSPEQFITVQRSLSSDALNEYIKHVGSALFAVPPGARAGGWVGETLFA